MPRPKLPPAARQAMAALPGVFVFATALAAPVDLWRITVKSHQGEPLLAVATLASLPEERISDRCLSMGPVTDAPDPDVPFLDKASLRLNASGTAVEIKTGTPVTVPALALVLRVQCPGAPLYARYFSVLIPPVPAAAAARAPGAHARTRPGFHLSVLRGDTVESIAAVIFPGHPGLQRGLVREVVAGNPAAFPQGQPREVPAGTVLWFPDLRELRASAPAKAVAAAPAERRRKPRDGAHAAAAGEEEAAATPREPVSLRRALQLGVRPGPQECRQLMTLCGARDEAAAPAPAADARTAALESGVKQLHLRQESIDQQLQRLEQSLAGLQKAVNETPARVAPSPPPAPKVEVRTVVRTEPVAWYVWLALAALVVAAAAGGFVFGRRRTFARDLQETDQQLDRMLASAASEMREFESPPRIAPAAPPPPPEIPRLPEPPAAPAAPPPPPAVAAPAPAVDVPPPAVPAATAPEPQAGQPPAQVAGLSSDVLFEMDQAMDNTRSMFTDVDRFIALGRTQNALSLLQFQVHKDPKDRDSWIKLMAIYRQEKMDAELAKAAREFRNNFPNENPPAV
ncbi:MAG TPA: hypothetical protein VFV71_01255 [Burkholderiales bacterium]|nr:hypothetical protein [Burkholderiales bacterium]